MEQGIEIKTLDKTGDYTPRYSYAPKEYGQATYIKKRCEEKGIAVDNAQGSVRIYSKRKIGLFVEIIKGSFDYLLIERPVLIKRTATFFKGQALVCVLTFGGKNAYVTENHMEDMVEFVYKRQIPRPEVLFIFDKKSTMVEALLDREGVIV